MVVVLPSCSILRFSKTITNHSWIQSQLLLCETKINNHENLGYRSFEAQLLVLFDQRMRPFLTCLYSLVLLQPNHEGGCNENKVIVPPKSSHYLLEAGGFLSWKTRSEDNMDQYGSMKVGSPTCS